MHFHGLYKMIVKCEIHEFLHLYTMLLKMQNSFLHVHLIMLHPVVFFSKMYLQKWWQQQKYKDSKVKLCMNFLLQLHLFLAHLYTEI